jgi:hypothetical protein
MPLQKTGADARVAIIANAVDGIKRSLLYFQPGIQAIFFHVDAVEGYFGEGVSVVFEVIEHFFLHRLYLVKGHGLGSTAFPVEGNCFEELFIYRIGVDVYIAKAFAYVEV